MSILRPFRTETPEFRLYTPETICYTDDKRQNNLPFTRSICIKAGIRIPIITVPVVKDHIRKAGDYVTLEEQRQAAIMNYVKSNEDQSL